MLPIGWLLLGGWARVAGAENVSHHLCVGNVWKQHNHLMTESGTGKLWVLSLGISVVSHLTFDLNFSAIASLSPKSLSSWGGPKDNLKCLFFLFKVTMTQFFPSSLLMRLNWSHCPAIYFSSPFGITLSWHFLIHMIFLDIHRWKEFHLVQDQKSVAPWLVTSFEPLKCESMWSMKTCVPWARTREFTISRSRN